MRRYILGILAFCILVSGAAADDYIIQDSNGNPLFAVNQTGEKQIYNGNLFLNGNSIVDDSGKLTLGGGDAEIPDGALEANKIQVNSGGNIDLYSSSSLQWSIQDDTSNNELGFYDGNQDILRLKKSNNVKIPNGNLQMNENEIQGVSALELGWANLTDYPTGCETDEAVQVVSDTLTCTNLNPGGTVETGGGAEGQVAFFIDSENVSGSDNLYWNNSEIELGIGTNNPSAMLDVNGETNLGNTVYMNGNDIDNPGNVDGVHLDSPGNAIGIDGSSQYYVESGSIGSGEIGSNAVTSSGSELDSSVAGTQLALNSGTLNVQDKWVNETGDTMTGDLKIKMTGSSQYRGLKLIDTSGNTLGHFVSDNNEQDVLFENKKGGEFAIGIAGTGSRELEMRPGGPTIFQTGGTAGLRITSNQNIEIPNGDISVSGNTDGIDLDNPGNGITINSNQYEIDSDSIDSGELVENSVTNTELANSDIFTVGGLTSTGDVQVQGDLDVWGNITNTNVENLNVNGSLLPPEDYSQTFDVGSSAREWRDAYFSGTGTFDNGLTVNGGTVSIPNDEIDNAELNNPGFSTTTNSGIDSESVDLGGDLTIDHADTSDVSDTSNSNGNVLQELTFDGFGHVETITTKNLDDRYYTESESNNTYIEEGGDTMSGSLLIDGDNRIQATLGNDLSLFGPNGFNFDTSGGYYSFKDYGTEYLRINQGGTIDVNTTLNMKSNSITNYFDSDACPSGEVVADIQDDGTYTCTSITGEAQEEFVNEAGDTMTGSLNMTGDDIKNVGTINASKIQESGQDIGGLFVDESGDSMSGNLNMQDYHIDNVGFLDFNSVGDIRTDRTDAIRIDSDQNIEVPNGNLGIKTNTPDTELDVNGSIFIPKESYVYSDKGGNGDLQTRAFGINSRGNVQFGDHEDSHKTELFAGGSRKLWADSTGIAVGSSSARPNNALTVDGDTDISGNLGIGSTSPSSKLEVNGGLNVSEDLFVDSSNGNVGIGLTDPGDTFSVNTGSGGVTVGDSNWADNAFAPSKGIAVQGDSYLNGRLGVGTSNPNSKVDVRGDVNISSSSSQVAYFSDTGIEFDQPLSLESSGPLSVSNGVDLTDSSSNTIDSYSTMYLTTSSGFESDIVLQPTGVTDIDSNLTVRGDLDLDNNNLENIGGITECAADEAILGDGSCGSTSNPTPSISEVLTAGNEANQSINMSSNRITNLQDPNSAQDAATKDYVDTKISSSGPAATTYNAADSSLTVDPFTELQIDEGAGLRLENPSSGTARISMGSHWKTFYVDSTTNNNVTPQGQENLNWDTASDISLTPDSTTGDNWNNLQKMVIDVDESQLAGSHLTGSGDTIDVDDDFVENTGDTMTGDLGMNYNKIGNVSEFNVSTSSSQVAYFSDTGIEFDQPLSLESSGPLSVSNGVDLTDTSSNTIESYSTMYLSTSSGSPSDIVLDPTGDVGVDSNLSITGDLDLQDGALKNVGSSNIDIGDGTGDIDMNGNQIYNADTSQFTGLGVADSLSAVTNEVSGYSMYVQNNVSVGGDIVGTGGDVAEMINTEQNESIKDGTVVIISGETEVKPSTEARDTAVAGVVSTDPGVRLAKERDGEPLALSGVVPVRATDVNGDIEAGDLMTTSNKTGYAMKCQDSLECHGAVIGKAMGSLDETGKVDMLVTLG